MKKSVKCAIVTLVSAITAVAAGIASSVYQKKTTDAINDEMDAKNNELSNNETPVLEESNED